MTIILQLTIYKRPPVKSLYIVCVILHAMETTWSLLIRVTLLMYSIIKTNVVMSIMGFTSVSFKDYRRLTILLTM